MTPSSCLLDSRRVPYLPQKACCDSPPPHPLEATLPTTGQTVGPSGLGSRRRKAEPLQRPSRARGDGGVLGRVLQQQPSDLDRAWVGAMVTKVGYPASPHLPLRLPSTHLIPHPLSPQTGLLVFPGQAHGIRKQSLAFRTRFQGGPWLGAASPWGSAPHLNILLSPPGGGAQDPSWCYKTCVGPNSLGKRERAGGFTVPRATQAQQARPTAPPSPTGGADHNLWGLPAGWKST